MIDKKIIQQLFYQYYNDMICLARTMITIPTMEKGATAFLVTGDASRNKIQTMPGGGFSTIRIELPAAWNELTASLGYSPLSDYQLEATQTGIKKISKNTASSYNSTSQKMFNMKGQRINQRPSYGIYIQQGQKRMSK